MTDLSDIKRGQIVRVRMAGVSVTKTIELFGLARSYISKVMTVFDKERRNFLSEAKPWKKAKAVQ